MARKSYLLDILLKCFTRGTVGNKSGNFRVSGVSRLVSGDSVHLKVMSGHGELSRCREVKPSGP